MQVGNPRKHNKLKFTVHAVTFSFCPLHTVSMLGDVQVFPQTPMRINSYFEESMGLYVMSRVDFCKKMTEKTGIPQQSLAKNSSGPLRLELQQHWPGRSFPVGN